MVVGWMMVGMRSPSSSWRLPSVPGAIDKMVLAEEARRRLGHGRVLEDGDVFLHPDIDAGFALLELDGFDVPDGDTRHANLRVLGDTRRVIEQARKRCSLRERRRSCSRSCR